jgi:hypothetical protein
MAGERLKPRLSFCIKLSFRWQERTPKPPQAISETVKTPYSETKTPYNKRFKADAPRQGLPINWLFNCYFVI